jgi:hypothetical protein
METLFCAHSEVWFKERAIHIICSKFYEELQSHKYFDYNLKILRSLRDIYDRDFNLEDSVSIKGLVMQRKLGEVLSKTLS